MVFAALVTLCAAAASLAPAAAQIYPNRPIKVVVPFPPGGPIDVMARLVSQKLTSTLGTVIVDRTEGGRRGRAGRLHAPLRRHHDDQRHPLDDARA
jgi:tripartite-type tricarboxylate transporter receptor subunit TctC